MSNRPRPLGAIRMLLTLLLVVDVLGLISAALIRVSGGTVAFFPVTPTLYGPQPYVLQQVNRDRVMPLWIVVQVRDPSAMQTVLGLLAHGLAAGVAILPMIIMARRLVDAAAATNPFTPAMARGLRRLGGVVLVGGLLAEIVRTVAVILLYQSALPDGHAGVDTQPFADTGIWWLVLGLAILAFAQVIDYGCKLRTELDSVI